MNSSEDRTNADSAPTPRGEHELQQVRESLRGLRFGSVTLNVQDGVIVQIDRTEKNRVRGNKT